MGAYSRRRDADGGIPQQEYTCVNVGCENGAGHVFTANHEDWFTKEKNIDSPVNCPECQAWRKKERARGDIAVACKFCRRGSVNSASNRLGHQRHRGRWEEHWGKNGEFAVCKHCESDDIRRILRERAAANRHRKVILSNDVFRSGDEMRSARFREGRTAVENYGFFGGVASYDVPTDLDFYRDIRTPAHSVGRHGPNELTHVMKEGGGGHEWEKRFGSRDPEIIVRALADLARDTGPDVVQCLDAKHGTVVKVNIRSGLTVILTDGGCDRMRIRTGWVADDPVGAITRKRKKVQWTAMA